MPSVLMIVVYLAVLGGALFLADAVVGFIRVARGDEDDAIGRRLQQKTTQLAGGSQDFQLVRSGRGQGSWLRFVPFLHALNKLVVQSGLKIDTARVVLVMAGVSTVSLLILLFVLPLLFSWLAIVLAAVIGVVPVLGFLARARTKRRAKFDEQLPDAIDLIIRSLKIGHPMNGAMQVIARDMPSPISDEFKIAVEEINYGRDIASALEEMTQRVGATDLGYVAVAVQIQQESGGNLVESLSKLVSVVRDRFRMFRKVKAITAEGRFSAWALSVFPLIIAGLITLVKHNYYTQVMDFPYFPHLVVLIVIMLIINVIAMRMLTTLKV